MSELEQMIREEFQEDPQSGATGSQDPGGSHDMKDGPLNGVGGDKDGTANGTEDEDDDEDDDDDDDEDDDDDDDGDDGEPEDEQYEAVKEEIAALYKQIEEKRKPEAPDQRAHHAATKIGIKALEDDIEIKKSSIGIKDTD